MQLIRKTIIYLLKYIGQKKSEGDFEYGEPFGYWIWWNEKGAIKKESFYKDAGVCYSGC